MKRKRVAVSVAVLAIVIGCGGGSGTSEAGSLCVRSCNGKQCGPDGCGGTCGTCGAATACFQGTCCTPSCAGRQCGDDGCGGTCGTCNSESSCVEGWCQSTVSPCAPGLRCAARLYAATGVDQCPRYSIIGLTSGDCINSCFTYFGVSDVCSAGSTPLNQFCCGSCVAGAFGCSLGTVLCDARINANQVADGCLVHPGVVAGVSADVKLPCACVL